MAKKKYIKPEIREESYILTVRAWITQSSFALQSVAETNTSVAVQQITERFTETSVFAQEVVLRSTRPTRN